MCRPVFLALSLFFAAASSRGQAVDAVFFEKKIRPVLVEQCQSCHSGKKVKSGLRMDSLQALLTGGESGPALVPGKPEESLLVRVIDQGEPYAMPPKGKLKKEEIADITRWVKAGAPWPGAVNSPITPLVAKVNPKGPLWSFQPPRQIEPPAVRDNAWCRGPIDRFLLGALEAKGLKPAPEADRRTLLRRLTFDLTGLPPTPDEMDAFLADRSADPFATVVDRLLASPAHGERWARHWLDLARYADSNGMDENMAHANAFRYRDWVINALNADMPYDQFVTRQIAGDLLPGDTAAEKAAGITATGFLVIGPKMLAEDDPRKMEMDIVDEQLDTLGRAFLGMTFGCARCHDHKFDPVSAADYHGLAAIFKSTKTMANFNVVAMWHERSVAGPEILARKAAQGVQLAAAKKSLNDRVAAERSALVKDLPRHRLAIAVAEAVLARQKTSTLALEPLMSAGKSLPTGGILLEAEKFDRGNLVRDFTTYGLGIGVVYNAGPIPNMAEYDFAVTKAGVYQVESRHAAAESRPARLLVDGKLLRADAVGAVTGSWTPESQRWGVEGQVRLAAGKHVLRLERDGPVPHVDKFALVRRDDLAQATVLAGPLLVADAAAEKKLPAGLVQAWVEYLGRKDVKKPDGAMLAQVLADSKGPLGAVKDTDTLYEEKTGASLKLLREAVVATEKLMPVEPMAMAAEEGKIGNLKIHLRGNYLTLGEEVPRVFPRAIAGEKQQAIDDKHSGRLELARWMARPENPLTARVIVNRLWHWHFGGGLVRTPDNFGRLGLPPANPALLDWLAVEMVKQGWSLKKMHRQMVLSSAYRMSCTYDEKSHQADPDNALFWRFNRKRLEAEALRDGIIAVAGDLDRTMGGTLLTVKNHSYVTSTASERFDPYHVNRRSVYLPITRSSVYDFFQAFDFADPSASNGERVATTVAPQALALLNSRLMEEKTLSWAKKLLARPGQTGPGRVEEIYRTALGRKPEPGELLRALWFVEQVRPGLSGDDKEKEAGSWQALCRVVLASSEFVHVD